MMRLPAFRYFAPRTLNDAVQILAQEGSAAMPVAGGTDLLPNMKRRQQMPGALLSLKRIDELKTIRNGRGLTLGAGLTLAAVVGEDTVRRSYPGLWQAAVQVATPHLRNMGTLGGNICLDTRCTYYDQNYEWRKSIDFCMKKDGAICWVSTGSKHCLATSSTDTAPALISLDAGIKLESAGGERVLPLADLYRDDGMEYLQRRPDEILTEIILPDPGGWRSTYWKLRRRGSFDFPIASVAAAVRYGSDGAVDAARIVLGAVSSRPLPCEPAAEFLAGKRLEDEVIHEAGKLCAKAARPVKNTDFAPHWRKNMVAHLAGYALRELRGDNMDETRRSIAQHVLI